MANWETNYGRNELRDELRKIEMTFYKANLRWDKINRQKEDALAVTVSIIKRQCRNGLIELKTGIERNNAIFL